MAHSVSIDTTEKILKAHNDVFSNIMNVALFGGVDIINEKALSDGQAYSQYKFDEELHVQERDVCKHWMDGNVRLALFGVENQSTVDRDMPLRVIGYDGTEYRGQLFSESTEDGSVRRNRNPRYPVVSLVLYFGERPWHKPMRLLDVLEIPAALENIVNDYKIRVLDLRRLERSVVDRFKSDFWIVADYFWQVQNTDGYKPSKETIVHIDEILDFFRYALRDDRFTMNYLVQDGEEVPRNMCEVMDRAVNQGRIEGKIEGRKEGKIDTLVDLVKRGLLSIDDAAKTADISADAFRKLLAN